MPSKPDVFPFSVSVFLICRFNFQSKRKCHCTSTLSHTHTLILCAPFSYHIIFLILIQIVNFIPLAPTFMSRRIVGMSLRTPPSSYSLHRSLLWTIAFLKSMKSLFSIFEHLMNKREVRLASLQRMMHEQL